MLRQPSFWTKTYHPFSLLLLPIAWIYYAIFLLRQKIVTPNKVGVPVISIGNVTSGGAGKTPVVLSLCKMLQDKGIKIAVVSRGYKGKYRGCLKVNPKQHHVRYVGDEALLVAKKAPLYLCRNRYIAAKQAEQDGAELILMDDGLQHPYLYKNMSLMVMDGGFGIGNGRLFPAGPMRQTIDSLKSHIDGVICINEDVTHIARKIVERFNISYWHATTEVCDITLDRSLPYIAYTGIGRPEKFYTQLKKCGLNIVATLSFPDHHYYNEHDELHLEQLVQEHNGQLITTEKDAVKLPPKLREETIILPIMLKWEKPEKILQYICEAVGVKERNG